MIVSSEFELVRGIFDRHAYRLFQSQFYYYISEYNGIVVNCYSGK